MTDGDPAGQDGRLSAGEAELRDAASPPRVPGLTDCRARSATGHPVRAMRPASEVSKSAGKRAELVATFSAAVFSGAERHVRRLAEVAEIERNGIGALQQSGGSGSRPEETQR